MTIFRFHCPNCRANLECPALDSAQETACPACNFRFIPQVEDIREETPAEPPKAQKLAAQAEHLERERREEVAQERRAEIEKIHHTGSQVGVVSNVMILLSVPLAMASVVMNGDSERPLFNPLSILSGTFLLGLILRVIAELIHIHANTEK